MARLITPQGLLEEQHVQAATTDREMARILRYVARQLDGNADGLRDAGNAVCAAQKERIQVVR